MQPITNWGQVPLFPAWLTSEELFEYTDEDLRHKFADDDVATYIQYLLDEHFPEDGHALSRPGSWIEPCADTSLKGANIR